MQLKTVLLISKMEKEFTSNSSVQLFALVTLLSLSSLSLQYCLHFTYFMIVLGIHVKDLGYYGLPPDQVLVGLALFLSLFTAACSWAAKERCVNQMTKEK